MDNNIIISNWYETLLVNEMVKSQYGNFYTFEEMFPDMPKDPLKEDCSFDDIYHINRDQDKVQDLLQMYLIYQKVIFPTLREDYNLSELVQMGEVEYETYESSREQLGFTKLLPEIDYHYACYLKPLIVEQLKAHRTIFSNTKNYTLEQCCSITYDYFYPNPEDSKKNQNNEAIFLQIVDENVKNYYNIYRKSLAISGIDPHRDFLSSLLGNVKNSVEDLCWQFELSAKYNCPIMQNTYNFDKIKYIGNLECNQSFEAFTLLRIECKNIFGELPHLQSFDEAIRLKKQKKHELRALRQELTRLEYTLKEEGREKAVEQAARDVHKASKSLNKSCPLRTVSKWTQYLAVPVGFAELYLQLPPYIGLTVEAIGQIGEQFADKKNKSNNWVELFR